VGGGRVFACDHGGDAFQGPVEHGGGDVAFVLEVPVHRAVPDAQLAGEVSDAGGGIPLGGEDRVGGVEDGLPTARIGGARHN
jgi:hypothetical protein